MPQKKIQVMIKISACELTKNHLIITFEKLCVDNQNLFKKYLHTFLLRKLARNSTHVPGTN